MNRYAAIGLSACSALAMTTAGQGVHAQGQDAGEIVMEEMIVTATKREQSLQDVPVAVTALSGDTLDQAFVTSVKDLALLAPSVTFSRGTHDLNSSVNIRGVGTSVFSSAVEPSVAFIIDGVVMSRQGQAFVDLIDIERVEVLRGPQSTLFGKNASAGVVNVVTKRPSDAFELSAEGTVAEQDEYSLKATLSGPLGDTLGARLTGFYVDRGGHIENVLDGRDLNGQQSYGLRGQLEWDVTDTINLRFIGDWRESNNDCCQYQPRQFSNTGFLEAIAPVVPSPTNTQVNVGADVFGNSDQWGLSTEINADIGEHVLTSITAYRQWSFVFDTDIDGTPSQGVPGFGEGVVGFDLNSGLTELAQVTQELRVASPADGPVSYVAGLFFYYMNLDRFFQRKICVLNLTTDACPQTIPVGPGVTIPGGLSGFFNGDVENLNYAAFGEVNWNATDRLTLTGGLRVLRERVDFFAFRPDEPLFPGDGVLQPAPVTTSGTIQDSAITGKFSIQYRWTDDIMTYATYTRGYKGPTVDVAFEPDDEEVAPETSHAGEIGVRSQLFDNRLTANVTLFWSDFSDFQAQTLNPEDVDTLEFVLENAGAVRTRGIELELTAVPVDSLTLTAGISYTDAEIRSFPGGQCFPGQPVGPGPGQCTDTDGDGDGDVQDLAGGTLTNAPDWKVNLTGRYDIALPSLPFDAFVTGALRWQSQVQFSISQNPNTIQEAYAIADASVGVTGGDGRYTLTFFVKNLFDQSYATLIFQDSVISGPLNLNHQLPKDADRYVGGSLRVNF